MGNFIQIPINLAHFSLKIVSDHFRILYHQLDPILSSDAVSIYSPSRQRWHNGFVLVAFTATILYGIWGLNYEATGNWILDFSVLSQSPYVFTHQLSPNSVWLQIDCCYALAISLTLGMFVIFLVNGELNGKWRMMYDIELGCLRHGPLSELIFKVIQSNLSFILCSRCANRIGPLYVVLL
jgi:hypothetical protein